jgi:hypothetical protein
MVKWINFILALLLFGAIGLMLTTAESPSAQGVSPASVRIVYKWQLKSGATPYDITVNSLGTVIAPRVILTHNHYGFSLGRRPSDTLTITDLAGHTWRGRALDAQLIVINVDTSLIWLPEDLPTPIAPVIESTALPLVAVGQSLTVNYWDEPTQGVAQRAFKIVQVKEGVVMLADPSRLINFGDSGGGVYFNGRLVGNIRSINVDRDLRGVGNFHVALVPPQIRSYMP